MNTCSHLVSNIEDAFSNYEKLKADGVDTIDAMLTLQRMLQMEMAKKNQDIMSPEKFKTAGELLDYIKDQDDMLYDENRELYTALGGTSNGSDAQAIWKKWKPRHRELRNVSMDDMSTEDKLEIKFEMVDQLCFILNKINAIGFSAKELFSLYYLKSLENLRRQREGY